MNLHAYVGGDPVNYADPLGYAPGDCKERRGGWDCEELDAVYVIASSCARGGYCDGLFPAQSFLVNYEPNLFGITNLPQEQDSKLGKPRSICKDGTLPTRYKNPSHDDLVVAGLITGVVTIGLVGLVAASYLMGAGEVATDAYTGYRLYRAGAALESAYQLGVVLETADAGASVALAGFVAAAAPGSVAGVVGGHLVTPVSCGE